MKKLRIYKESNKIIDNEDEHNKILFELGILDDLEDWKLFKKQEDKYNEILFDLSTEEYFKYIILPK